MPYDLTSGFLFLGILQLLCFSFAIVLLVMKLKISKCSKYKKIYQIPWIVWTIHFIIFYGVYFVDWTFGLGLRNMIEPDFFTIWSVILRLHLLGTFLSYSSIQKPFYKGGK